MDLNELEFLIESNTIEGETSIGAWADATRAWIFAKEKRYGLNLEVVQEIHYRVFRRINPRIAGKIRTCPIYVGNKETGYEECLKPGLVDSELRTWCHSFYKDKSWEAIRQRSIKFLKVHPFEDGNGRTGRILMNLQRINEGMSPLIIHHGKEQFEYYEWFK